MGEALQCRARDHKRRVEQGTDLPLHPLALQPAPRGVLLNHDERGGFMMLGEAHLAHFWGRRHKQL